jgi:tetratricopeptide (TPR) repeat protein
LQVFDEIADKQDIDQLLKLVEKVSLQYPTDPRVSAELYHLRVMQALDKVLSFSDRYNYGKHFELSPLLAEGYWLIEQLAGNPRQVKILNDVALLLYFEPADIRQEAFHSLLNKTFDLDPDNTMAHFYLAHWYQREKEMDKAIPHFLKAGNGPPVFGPALIEVAEWYAKNKKFEAAIEILMRAVPSCRTDGSGFFWLPCTRADRFLERMKKELSGSQADEVQDE